MPRIATHLGERAIGMLQAGLNSTKVAIRLGTTARTVKCLRERFHATGSTADRPRLGRPRVTTAAQNTNNINVLPWSAKSPDLNPIEHMWDNLDRRVRRR